MKLSTTAGESCLYLRIALFQHTFTQMKTIQPSSKKVFGKKANQVNNIIFKNYIIKMDQNIKLCEKCLYFKDQNENI